MSDPDQPTPDHRAPSPYLGLPERRGAKADPALVTDDLERFAAIDRAIDADRARLRARLDRARRDPARDGQEALDRDLEVRRTSAQLAVLGRFGVDACLGRMVPADGGTPVYIGRAGLRDADGHTLLVDWRTPAAAPFFAATPGAPMGLASRRRYRWANGRVVDYWDERLDPDAAVGALAPDEQSAFIASLGEARTPRMRDVLATISTEQDAVMRAPSPGALVVDGGPGTGKTVVALHRAAYLRYADPLLGSGRGGVLVVGPSEPYLAYVADVLPGLGEEGVRTCTLTDLVPEGRDAGAEEDARVADLKASATLADAIEPAVRWYERAPERPVVVDTPWLRLVVEEADWLEAFDAVEPGTAHNDARLTVWEALVDHLVERADVGEVSPSQLRRALRANDELVRAFDRAWPVLDAAGVVADLYTTPAYLRMCAPGLRDDEVLALRRPDGRAWTRADLPLLDAAHRRIGARDASLVRRRRAIALEAHAEEMDRVVDAAIESDDDGEGLVTMLRGDDARFALVDESTLPELPSDPLAGPFAHIVVDEAQELSDAEWRMLLERCPSGSFTIVGDRAQARSGFPESWEERLRRVGVRDVRVAALRLNYRTPAEILAEAAPVIRAAVPDANVPESVRSTGTPVRTGRTRDRDRVLDAWRRSSPDGVACVIGDAGFEGDDRVRSLSPVDAKGLEFDLVVLVDPDAFGAGVAGAVDRYVAMTRATRELVILR
ncbi:AAA family ATPase [Pseudoclavibacter chungangensis]|uniref:AAA family ATPase n=1 Tax=Pseudoclavibacter chungangensis TaxID=587635 RepID=A0A7J5C1Y0_9MICO|nr:RNA polymerase recycling motor ATPase HelR [Pseudoclavibacter chungangensis]KAB1660031.1 AAA family ATPase [Pseudoclavibacter chungangensis]NYJ66878.1 hypothetical protein [Pseudoclavibacter chungangensis]